VIGLVKKYFGAYKAETVRRNPVNEPEQQKERRITVNKETKIPYLVMLYQLPAGNHPDMPAIRFLLNVLVYITLTESRLNGKRNLNNGKPKKLVF
jgi:zinc protease